VGITAGNLLGLLDNLLTLGQDELDVAGVRHVRVDLWSFMLEQAEVGSGLAGE
jgi:hypothetical protein